MKSGASIQTVLFPKGNRPGIWAIVDPARDERLYWALQNSFLNYSCLYAGRLPPEVERVAPHLVQLDPDDKFTAMLEQHRGQSWCVFLDADITLAELRHHLRKFLTVRDHRGRKLLFRYYDPRVLSVYLPTCNDTELKTVFGPIRSFWSEENTSGALLQFDFNGQLLQQKRIELAPPKRQGAVPPAGQPSRGTAMPEILPAAEELLLAPGAGGKRTPIVLHAPVGSGRVQATLSCEGGAIRLFRTFAGGEEISMDSGPAVVTIPEGFDGLTLYAEPAAAGEAEFRLVLEGGREASARVRVIEASLRHDFPIGLFLPLASGDDSPRVPIRIDPPAGAAADTRLRITATGGDLRLFAGPDAAAHRENLLTPDYEFPAPPGTLTLWISGHGLSQSTGDMGLTLFLSGHTQPAAHEPITVYRQTPLEAKVPVCGKGGSGEIAQPQHFRSGPGQGGRALILPAGSISPERPIEIETRIEPDGVPSGWSITRNPGDTEAVRELSPSQSPTLRAKGSQAELLADAAGSFELRAVPGFAGRTDIPDHVPGSSLRVVFVHAAVVSHQPSVRSRFSGCQRDAKESLFRLESAPLDAPAAVALDAELVLTGGGPDGREGLEEMHAGWVNNILSLNAGAGYKGTGDVKLSGRTADPFENGPLLDAHAASSSAAPYLAEGSELEWKDGARGALVRAGMSPGYRWPIHYPARATSVIEHIWAYLECRSFLCVYSRHFVFTPAVLAEYGWSFTADYAVSAAKVGAALVKARVSATSEAVHAGADSADGCGLALHGPVAAEALQFRSPDGTLWPHREEISS